MDGKCMHDEGDEGALVCIVSVCNARGETKYLASSNTDHRKRAGNAPFFGT
jgi:hypothetical protein